MSPRRLSFAFELAATLGAVYAGEVQPPAAPTQPASHPGDASAQPPPSNDDAEKHLRRTVCLKDARTRKLVGAQRTAFVKDCVESTASD